MAALALVAAGLGVIPSFHVEAARMGTRDCA